MSVNHEVDRGSRSPSAAERLIERLIAAGVPARLEAARTGSRPSSIHVPRSERDRARAVAIRAGLKALRIESRPETRSDEILIATDVDDGTLAPICLQFDSGRERIPSAIANADLSSGGICIAISGGDGAGKSTAIAMLCNWLHPTFRIQSLHFGRPKPLLLSSLFYRFLGTLRRLRVHVPQPMAVSEGGGGRFGFLAKLVLVPQLLCLARDRRRTYRESRIAVGSGLIVLCDRYPDSRISDMEGPRLENLWPAPNRWQETLIRLEKSCYAGIVEPDVHVILRVSTEVARTRQPEDDPEALRRRVEAVARACAAAPEDVIVVDADASMAQVHADLRRIVWRTL